MMGAMKYINSIMTNEIEKHRHILKDSFELIKQQRLCNVAKNDLCVKFDVKDFFMSGTHGQLIEESSKILTDEKQRKKYTILAKGILDNQLI